MKIDAFGKPCPMPLVMVKKELDAGYTEIDIAVDNETAVENLTRLAKTRKLSMSTNPIEGGYLVSFSQNAESTDEKVDIGADTSANAAAGTTDRSSSATTTVFLEKEGFPQQHADYAVFIGKDHVGEGDFELGYSLMKMALYTLSESDEVPSFLLFMNSGVKLVCDKEGQIIANVNTLIERGTKVLVCGTCLDFYGIKGELQVGVVSNMYDILGCMQEATKVITL